MRQAERYPRPMLRRPEDRAFTVSEITSLIKGTLEEGFPEVLVEGEVSNCRPSSSGHLYFSLKDREAVLSAVMFRNRFQTLAFRVADGMLVRAHGAISVYPPRGTYQLVCDRLQAAGEGDLLALLEERKRRLAAEGLFDEARKRPLPLLPSRVAVVTSPTGAAVRDILRVLKRRSAGVDVVVLPAPVQGEGADAVIAAQIGAANRWALGDVLIVGRGAARSRTSCPFPRRSWSGPSPVPGYRSFPRSGTRRIGPSPTSPPMCARLRHPRPLKWCPPPARTCSRGSPHSANRWARRSAGVSSGPGSCSTGSPRRDSNARSARTSSRS